MGKWGNVTKLKNRNLKRLKAIFKSLIITNSKGESRTILNGGAIDLGDAYKP